MTSFPLQSPPLTKATVTRTVQPPFAAELFTTLSVHSQYVLHGNVRDDHLVADVRDDGTRRNRALCLEDLLWERLRRTGYKCLLRYDQVAGFTVARSEDGLDMNTLLQRNTRRLPGRSDEEDGSQAARVFESFARGWVGERPGPRRTTRATTTTRNRCTRRCSSTSPPASPPRPTSSATRNGRSSCAA
ncbi:hypothetical protein L1856_28145 [Streptomyces sp. Tue 6430]|nr:hypothetical protein [Streptomyces sp. Tue 6430]